MYRTFTQARDSLTSRFRVNAERVHTERWQGQDISKRPDLVSHELLNETIQVNLFGIEDLAHWRQDIRPNLPWADNHFLERVCGAPLNPGTEWANWPWASSADKHRDGDIFNHTYAERLWPKYASDMPAKTDLEWFKNAYRLSKAREGIRHEYGDLNSLIIKLASEPLTRQAYIPLYFPEDTGLAGRMPCTLGYQFIMRNNQLHVYYPLRSCDFIRHWADDCYLAVRLLLWVLDRCRDIEPDNWRDVKPGTYTMHMTSFHVFANDMIKIRGPQ